MRSDTEGMAAAMHDELHGFQLDEGRGGAGERVQSVCSRQSSIIVCSICFPLSSPHMDPEWGRRDCGRSATICIFEAC
jgi:hypothetical protein